MTCRALLLTLLAAVAVAGGASGAAEGEPAATPSAYHVMRPDPRLCPSPMCGGVWVRSVSSSSTTCGDGARARECYAAEIDVRAMRVDNQWRALLGRAYAEGRALWRGRLVRGRVAGFPELDTLVVSEVWAPMSSRAGPRGVLRRVRDNGVRCVKAPCFWIETSLLDGSRMRTISSLDLSHTGTSTAERRRALRALGGAGLVASGRIVRSADGGRAFVATEIYVRAGG